MRGSLARSLPTKLTAASARAPATRPASRFSTDGRSVASQPAGAELFGRLIGGHVRYLVDASNCVVQVEGIKELFDRAQDATGGGLAGKRMKDITSSDSAATATSDR